MSPMIHKIQHGLELIFIPLIINLQPFFGTIASCCIILYYIAITKLNVVDKKYNGSWPAFFKSVFKKRKS
jgi:hypothetical protein